MFRSGFVEVLGLRMHVREAGAGEPVLLLHGLGVSGRYFMPLACVLAARRHVIVPDLPGWGQSARPSRPLGVGGAADVLAGLLHRRGQDAVAIVANSFGCQVALMLAQRRRAGRAARPRWSDGRSALPVMDGSCFSLGSRLAARTARFVAHPVRRLCAHGLSTARRNGAGGTRRSS